MFLTESIKCNDAEIITRKAGIDSDRGPDGMREVFKKESSPLLHVCPVQKK